MNKVVFCKACGKIIDKYGNQKHQLCSKHFNQFRRFGKTLDKNQRTIYDPNEIRIKENYAEIDTYDEYGNVLETYILDIEDTPILQNKKWRTVYKGKGTNKFPYLVTDHTIYFHRLIMGNPNSEINHINRNTHDNRKENLRATRQKQMFKCGIKGIYYNPNRQNKQWHCEFQYNGKRYYSPQCEKKEEAVYYRFLYESFFTPDFIICNTSEFQKCIDNLSDKDKETIQKYFKNKAKAWV